MNVEPVPSQDRLRIAVVSDFDGIHTRSWLRWFIARGHDMHAVSFYPPRQPLVGVTTHILRQRSQSAVASSTGANERSRVPAGVARLAHAVRYRGAGLRRVLDAIAPDIVHAHFVIEHGFYAASAGRHPLVVTAWGSDILVAPDRDPISRLVAKWTLGRADLITSNNRHMAQRMIALGLPESKIQVVTLGADAYFGERWPESVNVRPRPASDGPIVLSTRAHEPLYNLSDVVDAYRLVIRDRPHVRLIVAHSGSLTTELHARAATIGGSIEFTGTVGEERLRDLMTTAEVFVSVPSSDGTSVALIQALAAGCFPVVANLESQHEWIDDGVNGLLVPVRDSVALSAALVHATDDASMRRDAAVLNRTIVAERGTNETEMARMERLYLDLAGR